MAFTMRELTDAEKEEFLKENFYGILSFAGDEPYAIPLGYMYRRGTMLLGFAPVGRKMDYLQRSRKVCFTICRPAAQTPSSKESYPFITVIIEGELEEITDRAYYGLEPLPEGTKVALFRIKQKRVGTQKLDSTP